MERDPRAGLCESLSQSRAKIGSRCAEVKVSRVKKEPRNLGPPDVSIPIASGETAVQLQGDGKVSGKVVDQWMLCSGRQNSRKELDPLKEPFARGGRKRLHSWRKRSEIMYTTSSEGTIRKQTIWPIWQADGTHKNLGRKRQ